MNYDAYEEAKSMTVAALMRSYRINNHVAASEFDRILSKTGSDLSEEERQRLIEEMEYEFTIFAPQSEVLLDSTGHEEWLRDASGTINWHFWSRYINYLQHVKELPTRVVDNLDELTDSILGYLEDPRRQGTWDRRGIVVGQVQSGKTANYTGLICKAADAGYKLIIVLAGVHNSLRSQTQLRIDEGFLGRDTNQFRVYNTDSPKIGVGTLPGICPDAIPLTTSHEHGDFKKKVAESLSLPFGSTPLIIVAKKNTTILKNLHKWIEHNIAQTVTGSKLVSGRVPLLMLDDEADNASVNTNTSNLEATKTNSLIRRTLNLFERRAYVGYTATPFANIFIPPDITSETDGDDLFPKSFIVNLRPPSNYIGPDKIFGLSIADDEHHTLPIIREITDAEYIFPSTHKIDHASAVRQIDFTQLPMSLHVAVRSFLLVCAARQARGQLNVHNSMLIHVTRYVSIQSALAELVKDLVTDLRRRIVYENGASKSSLMTELQQLWEEDFIPTSESIRSKVFPDDNSLQPLRWEEITEYLRTAVSKIDIREINGSAADALAYYDNQKHGISVIAIGGDKLSRGLTLEGLSVSYYLRTTYMYDTLMQMGRWFGYRPGYADLCRLFTSRELEEWYRHITQASEELRNEFDTMSKLRLTPRDFGLRVQTHPGQLLITSANKTRSGQKVRISYRGLLVQTSRLSKSETVLSANRNAVCDLIAAMDKSVSSRPIKADSQEIPTGVIWEQVSSKLIMEFLTKFQTISQVSRSISSFTSPSKIAEYIKLKQARKELTNWTVVLCSSSKGTKCEVAGHTIGLTKRTPVVGSSENDDVYHVRKDNILDPPHECLDLSEKEHQSAMEMEDTSTYKKGFPRGVTIRTVRPKERGLLLIYALDPTIDSIIKETNEHIRLFDEVDPRCDESKPIMSFVISFPGYGTPEHPEDTIEYLANTVWVENDNASDNDIHDLNDEVG